MFPAWAGNICLIFWSDATCQLFQIKFGPSLVLLGGEVQYCSVIFRVHNLKFLVGREVTSLLAMELVESPSMGASLKMRTSVSSTLDLVRCVPNGALCHWKNIFDFSIKIMQVFCRWPMRVLTPTGLSFSFARLRPSGLMENMWSLVRLSC